MACSRRQMFLINYTRRVRSHCASIQVSSWKRGHQTMNTVMCFWRTFMQLWLQSTRCTVCVKNDYALQRGRNGTKDLRWWKCKIQLESVRMWEHIPTCFASLRRYRAAVANHCGLSSSIDGNLRLRDIHVHYFDKSVGTFIHTDRPTCWNISEMCCWQSFA